MKHLPVVFILYFLAITNTYAAGGGGPSSSFLPVNPAIVVNIDDGKRIRHMQVMIQLKAAKIDLVPLIENHKAVIRHELIMLLSEQDMSTVSSAEGKERIREQALTAIQNSLKEYIDEPAIDAVYFTNFIVQ